MKRKLKVIIPIVIVLIIAIIIVIFVLGRNVDSTVRVGTETLMPQNLQNYISVSGTIESANSEQIYSKLMLPVDVLGVSVGDVVKKGDMLATLDSDEIRENITKMEEQIVQTDTNSENQITDAEKNYNNALKDYNDGVNSQVLSAKRQLDNAETALDRTKTAYEDALELTKMDKSTQLQTVNRSIESAQLNLENAERRLKNADNDALKTLKENLDETQKYYRASLGNSGSAENDVADAQRAYNNAVSAYASKSTIIATFLPGESIADYAAEVNRTKAALDDLLEKLDSENAFDNYEAAKLAYDNAKKDLEDAVTNAKTQLENAKTQLQSVTDGTDDGITSATNALSDAELNYANALRDYNLTIENVERNLSDLKTAAERAKINAGFTSSQEISLQNLKDQLDDATLTSPIDGVVTYVNASEGDTPEGIMFTVEDLTDLKMTVLVSEYDIANISLGMNCEIAPNSDPDTIYSGTITEIAPTTQKSALGVDAGTASFEVEVAVTSKDTKLDIGMTAQVKLIYEEERDVLSVSSDLVMADEGGKYVFKAVEGTLGTYTVKKVYVETGMETDFYISVTPVTAGELTEGDLIITDTARVRDGDTVTLRQTAAFGTDGNPIAGMADGMYNQVGAEMGMGTPGNRPPAGGNMSVEVVQVG